MFELIDNCVVGNIELLHVGKRSRIVGIQDIVPGAWVYPAFIPNIFVDSVHNSGRIFVSNLSLSSKCRLM